MIPVRPSGYLDDLDAEVARLVDLARSHTAPAPVTAAAHDRAVLATLQLDGSPITALPEELSVVETSGAATAYAAPSSWYTSFDLLEDAPDERILALEASGVSGTYASDDLLVTLADDPLTALAELHRRLTRGLLAPDLAGAPRRTDQAVQDAATGRVIYYTTPPEAVVGELDALAGWLSGPAQELTPLRAAGLLHLELLRIHPFEAANGRLARVAARLWLRREGHDPQGLAAAEPALAADRLGYHEEVAGSLRRRDAGPWLERWGEAVAAGLRRALHELGLLSTDIPSRSQAFLDARRPGEGFTVADLRAHTTAGGALAPAADANPGRAAVDEELRRLLDAGAVDRVPGSRGLRFVIA